MDASVVSRRVALDILVSCLDKGQPLDDALARHQGFAGLDPRDRAFVRLLLATTLRRLGEIDEVLGVPDRAAARRAPTPPAGRCCAWAPPSCCSSARRRTPPSTPRCGWWSMPACRISRAWPTPCCAAFRATAPALLGDRDPARLNTPQWLWDSWTESYGEEATRAIAAAHLIEAPLDLTPRSNADFWAGRLEGEVLPTGTIRREGGGNVTELPGFAEGAWWVQDAAATLPVRLLGDVSGKRVADLCAAPGGKTLQLAAAGAQVTAVDISARRMVRVGENLARAGLSAELVTADAGKWVTDADVRRHPARRALLGHRHPAAPSRHRLAEGRGGCRPPDAHAGPPAGARRRPAEAGRHAGLCRVLAAGGRRAGAAGSAAGARQAPAARAGAAGRTARPRRRRSRRPATSAPCPRCGPSARGMDGFYIARLQKSG